MQRLITEPLTETKRGFLESVHLLRGFAALAVVASHNFGGYPLPLFAPIQEVILKLGGIGVATFFVISGFVLPSSLHQNYTIQDLPKFMLKRIVRIEPTYIISIIICLMLLMLKTQLAPGGVPYVFKVSEFLAHLGYMIPFTEYLWYNHVYWTLAVEFQYYILIALIFPILAQGGSWAFPVLLGFCGLFLLRDVVPEIVFFAKAPLFAVGIVMYLIFCTTSKMIRVLHLGCIVVLCLIYGATTDPMDAAAAALTAVLVMLWKPPRLGIRYLGTISYSLYVTHYPVIIFTQQAVRHFWHEDGHPMLYLIGFLNVVFCLILAHYVYRYIEAPTQKLSKLIQYGSS